MSGIGSLGASSRIGPIYEISQTRQVQPVERKPQERSEVSSRREARLAESLSVAGIDAATAEAIKTDLKSVLETSFSAGKRSPESVKENVDAVFTKYNLSAEEILGAPTGPQGGQELGRAGGPPPLRQSEPFRSGYHQDAAEYDDLLSLVKTFAEKGTAASDLAQTVLDALYGFDETA